MKFLIIWEQSITYSDNYEVKCFMEQTHAGMEEIERVSMNLPSRRDVALATTMK